MRHTAGVPHRREKAVMRVSQQDDISVEEMRVAEEAREAEESRRNRNLLAGLALAVILLLVIWWILSQLVIVPDVVGMQEPDARNTIEDVGLSVSDVVRLPSEFDPAGEVVGQCPEAGVRVFQWRQVKLYVVTGDGLPPDDDVRVPDDEFDVAWGERVGPPPAMPTRPPGPQRVPQVFDMTESEAIARLARDGYRATVEFGSSSTNVAQGLVFFQDPPPDTIAPRGTMVTIRISTGPPVLGQPRTDE